MIDLKEVREGNYLQNKNEELYRVIREQKGEFVLARIQHRSGDPDLIAQFKLYDAIYELFPIPLSKRWFSSLGFRKNELEFYKNFNQGNAIFQIEHKDKKYKFCSQNFETEIHFVHQLQNLFFILTNEELEIKEDEQD